MIGVPPIKYAGHSFHIEAASTATLYEVKDSTLKKLGCWNSETYMYYFKLPGAALSHYSQLLVWPLKVRFNKWPYSDNRYIYGITGYT